MRQSSIVSSSCSSSSPGRGGGASMPDWRVIIAAAIPGFAAIITVRERRRQPGASDVSWGARPFVPEEDARSGKIERSYYCYAVFCDELALACALVAGLSAPAEAKSSL